MALGSAEGADRVNEAAIFLAREVQKAASELRLSERAFVFGGIVRDALRRGESARPVRGLEEATDLDVIVEGGEGEVAALARRLAELWGGRAIRLNRSFAVCRWSARVAGRMVTVDIQPARDLRRFLEGRDLTINAIAVPLAGAPAFLAAPAAEVCIDPTGGVRDLAAGLVRPCGPRAFVDDPVRILRACAYAAWPGFELDEGAVAEARRVSGRLGTVPPERLLEPVLASARDAGTYARFLRLLAAVGASPYVFGEVDPTGAVPLLGHLERALEALVSEPSREELEAIRFVIATAPIVAQRLGGGGASAGNARRHARAPLVRGVHARSFRRALWRWALAVDAVSSLGASVGDGAARGELYQRYYPIARALARSDEPRIVAACCLCLMESAERRSEALRPQVARPEASLDEQRADAVGRMCERARALSKSRIMREVANSVRRRSFAGGSAPPSGNAALGERILHVKASYILSGDLETHAMPRSHRGAGN